MKNILESLFAHKDDIKATDYDKLSSARVLGQKEKKHFVEPK